MTNAKRSFIVVVPAAGIGKRMHSQCPKQYLTIDNLTIIEHTVIRLLSHEAIDKVVIALGENDEYFADTSLAKNTKELSLFKRTTPDNVFCVIPRIGIQLNKVIKSCFINLRLQNYR